MPELHSALISAFYAEDPLVSPGQDELHVKENLLEGVTGVDGRGGAVFETMPHAGGGETIMFENGETAHVTENVQGGINIDMPGIGNDIASRPSLFGEESFYQGGEYIGTLGSDFTGNGTEFTAASGETLFSASPGVAGGMDVDFSSPLFPSGPDGQTFDLQNSFSEIETVSSHFATADLGTATDVMDGADFLGFF